MDHLKSFDLFESKKLHTLDQANDVLTLIRNNIDKSAQLIGGFGKGKTTSEHDIDILIQNGQNLKNIESRLKNLLNAKIGRS